VIERADELAAKHHAHAHYSLESLLADPTVEIVALNTPPYLHGSQGLTVLEAGKHLFCEKPLALTVECGETLIRTAETNRLRLTVDYVMRRNRFWQAAASLRRDGVLGALRHLDLANHAAGLTLPADHWFWDADKSGGIWIEHGVHFFDAFAWVAGTEGEIASSAAYRRDGVIDRVEALAHYGSAAAHFYHAFDQSGQTEQTTVTLAFERGYVTLREWVPTSIEILTTQPLDALQTYLPGEVESRVQADGRTFARAFAPEGKAAVYRACIQDGLRDLAQAVRDPNHALAVTGREGLASLRLAVDATQAV
jgi:predicted dehydrogenase